LPTGINWAAFGVQAPTGSATTTGNNVQANNGERRLMIREAAMGDITQIVSLGCSAYYASAYAEADGQLLHLRRADGAGAVHRRRRFARAGVVIAARSSTASSS
jgi:hypothetical protein